MSWSYRRSRNWFGAAVLIADGAIGLLVNFNLISAEIVDQLWKLCPAIPLAIGLSLLLGLRRNGDSRAALDPRSGYERSKRSCHLHSPLVPPSTATPVALA